ncbi:MAG: agmatine deiminase family protein, partial [Actinomycetota bacterium]
MPAEWEKHERTWMAWPSAPYTLGEGEIEAEAARTTWANVANAIVPFEPVSVLCNSSDLEMARAYLDARVEIIEAELDDAWMRDIAPTFVRTSEGKI